MSQSIPLLAVVGPTASGKSDFAQELALQVGGEILNIDSQQFYKGFDIGTGKVPSQERKVKHWLLDRCDPGESMTAMQFVHQADKIISQLQNSHIRPILAGGTGLYFRALLEGLDPLPGRDPQIREKLQEEFQQEGGEKLHDRLKKIDPLSAAKISPQDSIRIIRYLEIHLLSGKPPSELMKRGRRAKLRYPVQTYLFSPPRECLRIRIEHRVKKMIEAGWLEEVQKIMREGISFQDLQHKPIGYADLAEVVGEKITLTAALSKIILRTQQYAKRQETFFRGLFKNPAYRENGCRLETITTIHENGENIP